MKIGEGEYKLTLDGIVRGSPEGKKEIMGEWSEEIQPPKIIYIMASNYQIAKNLYRNLFPNGRIVDLSYVRDAYIMRGTRVEEIIFSNERYPSSLFYERLYFLRYEEAMGRLKLISEDDFRKRLNDQLQTEKNVKEDRT